MFIITVVSASFEKWSKRVVAMGIFSSLFSGRQREEQDYSDGRANESRAGDAGKEILDELYEGMTLELFLDNGELLLSGRMVSFEDGTVTLERLPGGLSFRLCEPGTVASMRGCSRKMMQFSVKGVVQEATRVRYKLKDLRAETYAEQRGNFRLMLNIPMSMYYQEDEHFENPEQCTLVDISVGGVCVESEFLHTEGEVLRMRIKLEEYAPMEFLGEVVRAMEARPGIYHYGILFAQLAADETETLTRTLYNIQRGNKILWYRHDYGHW